MREKCAWNPEPNAGAPPRRQEPARWCPDSDGKHRRRHQHSVPSHQQAEHAARARKGIERAARQRAPFGSSDLQKTLIGSADLVARFEAPKRAPFGSPSAEQASEREAELSTAVRIA